MYTEVCCDCTLRFSYYLFIFFCALLYIFCM